MGWVAFLRAINLGPRNKVPMATLRRAFEDAGCTDVRTYIQSGNVLFTTKRMDAVTLGRRLERAVEEECGVKSTVILRTWAELRKLLRAHPFGADTSKTSVTFLAAKPAAKDVRRLQELDIAPDEVKVNGRDVYVRYPRGVQGARLSGAQLERVLGVQGTNRSWRTVARLAELTEAR